MFFACKPIVRLAVAQRIAAFSVVLLVGACATPTGLTPESKHIASPDHWYADKKASRETDKLQPDISVNGWLEKLKDNALTQRVSYALANNRTLKAEKASVAMAAQGVIISDADKYPTLSMVFTGGRDKQVSAQGNAYNTRTQAMLKANYELDVWGKLSSVQKKSQLEYAARQADYQHSQIQLAADISAAWFNLIEAQQLLKLYEQRANNLQDNLDNIQASYRLGISQALDVYLAKNDVNSERARIADEKKIVLSRSRQLELLSGDYPAGLITINHPLVVLNDPLPLGMPARLLTQRADIRAAWYDLLAKDAALAIAHKQRFPGFALIAEGGGSTKNLENLLSGSALAWSLLGSITAPIFNAGKLASQQEQARLVVVESEQVYLEKVYQAFAEVESAISEHKALNERYHYYQQAKDNAMSAEKLAFDQYMNGLVSYATVLEAQRRSFDSQTAVIQLKNQLLQNRIRLHVALGGDFESKTPAPLPAKTGAGTTTKGQAL